MSTNFSSSSSLITYWVSCELSGNCGSESFRTTGLFKTNFFNLVTSSDKVADVSTAYMWDIESEITAIPSCFRTGWHLVYWGQLGEDVTKIRLETKREDQVGFIDDQHGQGGRQVKISLFQVLREAAY